MKILFVNERCGYFGGVEQNVADAAEGLRRRGHACVLAYGAETGRDPAGYRALFDEGFACVEAGAAGEAAHLTDAVERLAPDVLYFHKAPSLPSLPHGVRAVRMVHDHDLCCPRRHKYFLVCGRVCRHRADWRCYADLAFLARDRSRTVGVRWVSIPGCIREMRRHRSLDALLVGSRFMQEELLQNGFAEEQVHILPNAVPAPSLDPQPVPQAPSVLYVGQLIRGKGVDLLLRALAQMGVRFEASIVGTGNAEARLQAMCRRLGLAGQVRFEGWVPHEDLARHYAAARVVAVPSRWPEPFGMIGLEAMLQARPVVGFDVGGIPDWLEHEVTGLRVPEQDVTAFARALERVLTDPDTAARLGRNGRERACAQFSFDRYLDRLEAHLGGHTSDAARTAAERATS